MSIITKGFGSGQLITKGYGGSGEGVFFTTISIVKELIVSRVSIGKELILSNVSAVKELISSRVFIRRDK